MLAEKGLAADIGQVGIGLVIMLAAHPGEGVIHLGIGVEGHIGIGLERLDDFFLGCGWGVFVGLGDVQRQGMANVFGLFQLILDADAVIAHRGIAVGAG